MQQPALSTHEARSSSQPPVASADRFPRHRASGRLPQFPVQSLGSSEIAATRPQASQAAQSLPRGSTPDGFRQANERPSPRALLPEPMSPAKQATAAEGFPQ